MCKVSHSATKKIKVLEKAKCEVDFACLVAGAHDRVVADDVLAVMSGLGFRVQGSGFRVQGDI